MNKKIIGIISVIAVLAGAVFLSMRPGGFGGLTSSTVNSAPPTMNVIKSDENGIFNLPYGIKISVEIDESGATIVPRYSLDANSFLTNKFRIQTEYSNYNGFTTPIKITAKGTGNLINKSHISYLYKKIVNGGIDDVKNINNSTAVLFYELENAKINTERENYFNIVDREGESQFGNIVYGMVPYITESLHLTNNIHILPIDIDKEYGQIFKYIKVKHYLFDEGEEYLLDLDGLNIKNIRHENKSINARIGVALGDYKNFRRTEPLLFIDVPIKSNMKISKDLKNTAIVLKPGINIDNNLNIGYRFGISWDGKLGGDFKIEEKFYKDKVCKLIGLRSKLNRPSGHYDLERVENIIPLSFEGCQVDYKYTNKVNNQLHTSILRIIYSSDDPVELLSKIDIDNLDKFTELSAPINDSSISISADDYFLLYHNGKYVGGSGVNWTQGQTFDLNLSSPENIIAIKSGNTGGSSGMIAEIHVNGKTVVSNKDWKVSNKELTGWINNDFDDSNWKTATQYGVYGLAPWGKNVVGFNPSSSAQWIWSGNQSDKRVYFRIKVDSQGNVLHNNDSSVTTTPATPTTIPTAPAPTPTTPTSSQSSPATPATPTSSAPTTPQPTVPTPTASPSSPATPTTPTPQPTVPTPAQPTPTTIPTSQTPQSANNQTIPAISGSMTITGDDALSLWVNGNLVGSSSSNGNGGIWTKAQTFTINLSSPENVIAVKGTDAGGRAGMIAEVKVGGTIIYSSAAWKVSTTEVAGWNSTNFDDSQWKKATHYGVYGVAPWGKNVVGFNPSSSAQWIWSGNNDSDNEVYFRLKLKSNGEPL